MNYRNLTTEEIDKLKSLGNRSSNWQTIRVAEHFDAERLTDNRLEGDVTIGEMTESTLSCTSLSLPIGISGSWLQNCTIGNNCAVHNVKMLSGYTVGNLDYRSNV